MAQVWPGHSANHMPAMEGHTDCLQGHMSTDTTALTRWATSSTQTFLTRGPETDPILLSRTSQALTMALEFSPLSSPPSLLLTPCSLSWAFACTALQASRLPQEACVGVRT